MKRYGWKIVVLLILAALVFVWLIRAPLLSAYLSNKMGIDVSMQWIGIWPSHTRIHDFALKNPPGFKGRAFKAEEVDCNYSFEKIFSDPTVIDLIEIKHSVLRIDFTNPLGTANNWTVLGQMIPKNRKNSNVLIRKLILTDFNVEVNGVNLLVKVKETHFERLEFDDISSQNGFPTARLVKLIFQSSGIEQYIQDLFNPEENIQKILSPLKVFGT